MASHSYSIGFFSSTTKIVLIEPTRTIKHKRVIGISLWSGKSSTLKSHDHESESYSECKNFLLKITQLSPWQITFGHFFTRVSAAFVRHHFLWMSYLSISRGVFVMCHFCKVPLFQMALKGTTFVGCI